MNKFYWLHWFRKTQERQNDRAVAALLKQQAEDSRPLYLRLKEELDGDTMPECPFILISKDMIAEAIAGLCR